MSEEEIKAIDNFKRLDFFEYDWQFRDDDFETREEMLSYAEKMQKIILNLIEKQRKEIEELEKEINILNDENELLKLITKRYNSYCVKFDDEDPRIILAHKNYFDSGVFTSNYISKDKIREKIKELENNKKIQLYNKPSVVKQICLANFRELLEEN